MFDPKMAAKYKGQISQYDDSMSIAEAAVYLKSHQPDLGIDNPYELNKEQFDAAVALLKQQKPNVGEYWSDAADSRSRRSPTATTRSARPGSTSISPCWPTSSRWLRARRVRVSCPPRGDRDGPDTWMISSRGQASELHVHVDGLHRRAGGERRSRRSRSARPRRREGLRTQRRHPRISAANTTLKIRRSGRALLLGSRRWRNAATAAARTAWTTTTGSRHGPRSRGDRRLTGDACATEAVVAKRSVGRRLAGLFHGRPRLQVGRWLAGLVAGW